jgi:hypothetical protein
VSDYFFVKDGFKEFQIIRTCTRRSYDITNCSILVDGHIDENNGLIPNAIPVSDSYVAELLAKSKPRRKASKMKRLPKEEAVN